MKDLALALRPTVFPPHLALRIAAEFDGSFHSLWYPSIGASVDSLELCAISLGASRRSAAGTGVIRLAEYDLVQLADRINTLAQASGGRFILGVGTGGATGRAAIDQLVDKVEKLRASRHAQPMVPVYFAALGPRMVRAAFQHAEGVLLNFCSPGYVRSVTRGVVRRDGHRVACYIKLFFAETDAEAIRMLADEFVKYDSAPQYHAMFQAMGLSGAIEGFRSRRDISERSIPEKIKEISLYNPTREQILQIIARFEEEGVDLPVVYPYVATKDDDFRIKTVAMLSQLAR